MKTAPQTQTKKTVINNPFLMRGDDVGREGRDLSNKYRKRFDVRTRVDVNPNDSYDYKEITEVREIEPENLEEKYKELDAATSFEAMLGKAAITNDLSCLNVLTPLNRNGEIFDNSPYPENPNNLQEALIEKAKQEEEAAIAKAKQEQEQKLEDDPFANMTDEQIEAYLAARKEKANNGK